MPFRLSDEGFPGRAKVQFTTSAEMPHLIYKACLEVGCVSNTVYIQHAIVDALARDLQMDPYNLLAALPAPRGPSAHLYDPADGSMNRYRGRTFDMPVRIGPANTNEEVR